MNEAEKGASEIGKMLDDLEKHCSFKPLEGKLYHLKKDVEDNIIDKPLFDGNIKDDSEYGLQFKVIETIDSKGSQIVYLYKKIGAVWSGEGKHPNLLMSGTIDAGVFDDEEKSISMWKNIDKDSGDEWVKVKVEKKYEQPK